MDKIEFTPWEGAANLAEIFQCMDIKFSLLDKDNVELLPKIKCRDYLGDCVWSKLTGHEMSIYGVSYNFSETPYEENNLKMTLRFPTPESQTNFVNNISYLHKKEEKAGTEKTKVYETQEKDTLIVEADKVWLIDQWRISLYSFYLKLLAYANPEQPSGTEREYKRHLTSVWEKAMLSVVKTAAPLFREPEIYEPDEDGDYDYDEDNRKSSYRNVYEIHGESGFYSILIKCMSYPPNYFGSTV